MKSRRLPPALSVDNQGLMALAAVMNLFFCFFFWRTVITAAVCIASTIFFAVTFITGTTIFRAAINCSVAAAFTIYGFAVVAVRDKGILMSLHHGKGTCYCNA